MREIIQRPEWDHVFYYAKQKWFQKKVKNETQDQEIEKVKITLEELRIKEFIKSTEYSLEEFTEFRAKVHDNFFIFWTAINPPMERLLFALSEILQPKTILGLGIFTGNPLIWSLGPAIQKIYSIEEMVGVEIDPKNAKICQENMDKVSGDLRVTIFGEDGFEVLDRYEDESIDLLYLDANGFDPATQKNSKNINYSFAKKAYPKLKTGGLMMCHNAYQKSFQKQAKSYMEFTANPKIFKKTVTIGIDEMGLEFSIKN